MQFSEDGCGAAAPQLSFDSISAFSSQPEQQPGTRLWKEEEGNRNKQKKENLFYFSITPSSLFSAPRPRREGSIRERNGMKGQQGSSGD